jgi:hypothetical protein
VRAIQSALPAAAACSSGSITLIYARRSANASRVQTKQQKQAAKDAAQPMVWIDVRGDDGQGQALVLLLGNSGPSIARNVKVVFDPAPPSTLDIKPILENLKQGIASLPLGRTMQWALGAPHNAVDWDARNAYRVRIDAEGPFGAIETVEYVISVDDLDGSPAGPPGNLHAVAAELREMTKATKELNETSEMPASSLLDSQQRLQLVVAVHREPLRRP